MIKGKAFHDRDNSNIRDMSSQFHHQMDAKKRQERNDKNRCERRWRGRAPFGLNVSSLIRDNDTCQP